MARSSYIYLVTHPNAAGLGYVVKAAFTVKHECQSWLEDCPDRQKRSYVVLRYADSPYGVDNPAVVSFEP